MRFKTFFPKETRHKEIVTCVNWSSNDEVYSVSDDHQIYKWDTKTRESVQVAKLPDDFFPTDLHWLIQKGTNKGSESLLITSTDGRYIILNKSGRVERNITAHTASISMGRWSPDGAGLLTAGEDGVIKVWSRSGMLRSTIVQNEGSVKCACWSPTSLAIVYSQGGYIAVKPLTANSKLTKWRGHEGMVLCLSWSNEANLIASGGEDCRYKVWDDQGSIVYSSSTDDHPITSIDFSSDGELLAVGGFNILKLCSFYGWAYSSSRFNSPSTGSLYSISWSPDGTQIISGSSTGTLIFANVVDQQLVRRNLRATQTGRRAIHLLDIVTKTADVLDFTDRIIKWKLDCGHLVVATSNQIHVFNENYVNTPIIIDGRTDVRIIGTAKKYFYIVDNSNIWVYTYSGRLHLNPRFPGSQVQMSVLSSRCISFGFDILAVRDLADQSALHIFNLLPGATRQNESFKMQAKTNITEIAVGRAGNPEDQHIVFIDTNRDLYIFSVAEGPEALIFKIGTQVASVMWASESNILVALHDSSYSIWYCPGESACDPNLIALTTITFDLSEFGRNVTIESFEGCAITFKSSGALYTISVNIYCEILHKFVMDRLWNKALKICRLAEDSVLWATLAAISTKKNQLDICEEAYSAAIQIDKVNYLQHIKNCAPSSPEQMAENSVMMGRLIEAETILLHNKKIREAISMCIRMHQWDRALDIAVKQDGELQFLQEQRSKYLLALNKEEFSKKYLELPIYKTNNLIDTERL